MAKQRNFQNTGPGMRGKNSLPVYQLGKKLEIIAVFLRVGTTPNALAVELDIPESTIRDVVAANACTPDFEMQLVKALRDKSKITLNPRWQAWNDPSATPTSPEAQRKDTPTAFQKKLADANPPEDLEQAPSKRAEVVVAADCPRPIGFVRKKPENSAIAELAALSVNGVQPGEGTLSLEFTLACGVWRGASIAQGLVTLDMNPAMLSKQCVAAWRGTTKTTATMAEDGSKGRVSLAFGGTELSPFWRVTAMDGAIGTFSQDPGFAALEGLAPGTEVKMTFGTWLCDIEDSDDDLAGDGLLLIDATGQEQPVLPEQLSARKRRLISIIRKSVLNARPDGYVALAAHTLAIVEKRK
jgi:hypothetical protein